MSLSYLNVKLNGVTTYNNPTSGLIGLIRTQYIPNSTSFGGIAGDTVYIRKEGVNIYLGVIKSNGTKITEVCKNFLETSTSENGGFCVNRLGNTIYFGLNENGLGVWVYKYNYDGNSLTEISSKLIPDAGAGLANMWMDENDYLYIVAPRASSYSSIKKFKLDDNDTLIDYTQLNINTFFYRYKSFLSNDKHFYVLESAVSDCRLYKINIDNMTFENSALLFYSGNSNRFDLDIVVTSTKVFLLSINTTTGESFLNYFNKNNIAGMVGGDITEINLTSTSIVGATGRKWFCQLSLDHDENLYMCHKNDLLQGFFKLSSDLVTWTKLSPAGVGLEVKTNGVNYTGCDLLGHRLSVDGITGGGI